MLSMGLIILRGPAIFIAMGEVIATGWAIFMDAETGIEAMLMGPLMVTGC